MATQKYILIDTENVGFILPNNIEKLTKYVYFIQNSNIKQTLEKTIKTQYSRKPHAFSLVNIEKYEHKKNCMDMCITKYALDLAIKNNNIAINILSRDKGYDTFIKYLKKSSKTNDFQRIEQMSIVENATLIKNIPSCCDINETILTAAIRCHSMEQLKDILSKKQRKKFIIMNYMNEITGKNIQMEYDLYAQQYILYLNGNFKAPIFVSKNANECKKEFNRKKEEFDETALPFKTKENYSAIKSLKALKIVNKGIEENSLSYEYLTQSISDINIAHQVAELILN